MADFALDTFTGTGDLSTHVPELNTWQAPGSVRPIPSLGNNDTFMSNPGLSMFQLDGAGTMKLNLSSWSSFDSAVSLVPATDPAEADYAIEATLALPAAASAPSGFEVDVTLMGRAWNDTNGGYNCVTAMFAITVFSGAWTVTPKALLLGGDIDHFAWGDDVAPNFSNEWTNVPTLTGAAQSLKLRAEFEGRVMRVFINDTPMEIKFYPGGGSQSGTTTAMDWTDPGLDGGGRCGFGLFYQNFDTGAPDAVVGADKFLGTYDFLVTGPGSPFWTNYVLTREVLS